MVSGRFQQSRTLQTLIGDLGFHSGRHAQCPMDAAEVVEHKPQRDDGPVVLPLLAEGVRESRESARRFISLPRDGTDWLGADDGAIVRLDDIAGKVSPDK
jgi:hypothetical protein